MASEKRTSVVSDIAKVAFRAKPSMTEDHWKEIGALLQKANEHRWSFASQEPSGDLLDSKRPDSRSIRQPFNSVQDGSRALLRGRPHHS